MQLDLGQIRIQFSNKQQKEMLKRFVFKEEAKCNFCQNWFQVFSEIKFGLNICKDCIHKALNTQSFKLPTPEGYLYQVYLARRHVSILQAQSPLMETLDTYMHTQLRQLLEKWDQIAILLNKTEVENQNPQFQTKFKAALLKDSKKFSSLTAETIQCLIKEPCPPETKKGQILLFTPLKQKNQNVTARGADSKSFKRNSSKKSLKAFKENQPNSMRRTIFLDTSNHSNVKKQECSPFSLGAGKMGSARNLNYSQKDLKENKEFATKSQNMKNSIGAALQGKAQIVNEPLKIMKQRIFEAIQNTNCLNKCIQLVAHELSNVDMSSYLSNLSWQGVEVVKFVKTGITDGQLRQILDFISDKQVETLVLTGNNLTEDACKQLLECQVRSLQNVYLGRNQIVPLKVKNELRELKKRYNCFV